LVYGCGVLNDLQKTSNIMILDSSKLYDLMADRGFQAPRTGNLFFSSYIYTYKPELEYQCGRKFLIEKIATTKQLSQLSCDQYV
jgi:hypothetical protein